MLDKNSVEFIYCNCNCGKTTWKYDSRGRERHFIKGHAWIGKKHSIESKTKIGKTKKGKKRSEVSIRKQFDSRKGYKHTEETKQKISKSHIGKKLSKETLNKITSENNHNWVGDEVGYKALHLWVRRHFQPPEKCHMCLKVPPRDLSNITGIYNREFKNWAYFCIRCHKLFDNLVERNFRQRWERNKKKSVSNS